MSKKFVYLLATILALIVIALVMSPARNKMEAQIATPAASLVNGLVTPAPVAPAVVTMPAPAAPAAAMPAPVAPMVAPAATTAPAGMAVPPTEGR